MGNTSVTTCTSTYVTVTTFTGHLRVAPGRTAQATVFVTMSGTAPNACEGAHFPFHYTGLATEVHP